MARQVFIRFKALLMEPSVYAFAGKHAALQDIRDIVERKLQQMLARNPMRMDYYRKYQEIVANYNREKDRVTVEETFAQLVELANSLDAEQRRAAEEGLSEDEFALFQMLFKDSISKVDRRSSSRPASRSSPRCGSCSRR
ncbi:type I restriction enzyme endonuclease domain-containing protein [Archangium sp.]|uniref:type I restriction enzyme endonuclease domain-containing protein n=1 Tax=Archangium sp. TaxID=1872627 RepID=UPI003899AADC